MDAIRTVGKNGVSIEEYKGEFALVGQYEGKDGVFRMQWVKFHKGKDDYQEKDWPLKIGFGDKATAVSVLKMLLAQLEEGKTADDSAPF